MGNNMIAVLGLVLLISCGIQPARKALPRVDTIGLFEAIGCKDTKETDRFLSQCLERKVLFLYDVETDTRGVAVAGRCEKRNPSLLQKFLFSPNVSTASKHLRAGAGMLSRLLVAGTCGASVGALVDELIGSCADLSWRARLALYTMVTYGVLFYALGHIGESVEKYRQDYTMTTEAQQIIVEVPCMHPLYGISKYWTIFCPVGGSVDALKRVLIERLGCHKVEYSLNLGLNGWCV